jgi:hypothetical protein
VTCFSLLGVRLVEKFFELFELVLPEDAIDGEPVGGLLERRDVEAAYAGATDLLLGDEARALEYVEVFEDRWHRDGVRAGELGDGCRAALESAEDAAAGGVAEGAEGGVERGGILNHSVK